MKKALIIFLASLFSIQLFAQENDDVFWTDSLRHYERRLAVIGDSMLNSKSMFVRQANAKKMIKVFRQALKVKGGYNYPFDSLVFISKLRPKDDAFRMFTWILKIDGGKYRYFGVVHMNDPKRFVYHPLFDRSSNEVPGLAEETNPNSGIIDSVYNNKSWFGMHYYDVGLVKEKKFFGLKSKSYYVLTGWDGNNNISHKKIIDVMYFKNGEPIFGAPVFEFEGKTQTRVVLEYNAQAVITLKWHHNDNMISFDHLVPPSKKNIENKFTYIPSGQYDYLLWKNGSWKFEEDLFNTFNKPVDEAN
ncbi:MAG: hypothetical protein ACPGLV_00415 [Bacteroidia bacterium]